MLEFEANIHNIEINSNLFGLLINSFKNTSINDCSSF